jgi:hypothetical protein
MPALIGSHGYVKVITTRREVAAFNRAWPCSRLSSDRHYWFEFDRSTGDLVDTDVPEHSDGSESVAMMEDCKAYALECERADWMID